MARLVLGDPEVYSADRAEAFDARSGVNVTVEIERQRAALPRADRDARERPADVGDRLPLLADQPAAQRHPPRRPARPPGAHLRHDARTPTRRSCSSARRRFAPPRRCWPRSSRSVGAGPVGVLAAASAEAGRTAAEHIALLARLGVQAVDLGVTIDTVDYAEQDPDLLERHRRPARDPALRRQPDPAGRDAAPPRRGERRPARHRPRPRPGRGADRRQRRRLGALGGDDRRRLVLRGAALRRLLRHRPPRPGHPGGDRALRRRHRRPEPDRRQPARPAASSPAPRRASASASASSRTAPSSPPTPATRLEAAGQHGFVLVEIDPTALVLQSDSFVANGIRLTVLAPGRCRRPRDRRGRAGSTGGGGGRAPRRAHRGPRRRGPAGLPRPQAARAHDARARQRRRRRRCSTSSVPATRATKLCTHKPAQAASALRQTWANRNHSTFSPSRESELRTAIQYGLLRQGTSAPIEKWRVVEWADIAFRE